MAKDRQHRHESGFGMMVMVVVVGGFVESDFINQAERRNYFRGGGFARRWMGLEWMEGGRDASIDV